MTIKQHGGVFGRNPKFNDVEAESLTIAGNAVPDASTILVDGDIGSTVQGYDADTAKYDDATANFTGTLQNGGSDVLVDTDIGSTVQGYDADTAKLDAAQTWTAAQTFNENLIFESGNGIDFSATADSSGTVTSEVLSEYEAGTWTPEVRDLSDSSLLGSGSGKYIRVGDLVTCYFQFTTPASATSTGAPYIPLPFTAIAGFQTQANMSYASQFFGGAITAYILDGADYMRLSTSNSSPLGSAVASGTTGGSPRFYGSISFIVG